MPKAFKSILFFILFAFNNYAQNVNHSLINADAFSYKNHLYIYGYYENKSNLIFKCYRYNTQLVITDSTEQNLGKHAPSDYLEITTDTLHQIINFYLQVANQKNTVTLLRYNDTLNLIAFRENYDANRINSINAFDDESYNYNDDLYIIRTSNTDTSGKQFFLTKYKVQSITKPFEYDIKWQFAFERKFIHRATTLYADSQLVLVYANVFDGPKKGQWILRINAQNGELIKGTKLQSKRDVRSFLLSKSYYDKKQNILYTIGSIYGPDMIDIKNNKFNFVQLSKQHKLFLVSIDSVGEIINRVEKLFALPIQTNTGKSLVSYHIKIREFNPINKTDFDVWADMYELSKPTILTYYSSWHINIKPDDVDYAITPSRFYVCSNAIPKLISFEKGDNYGKFHIENIGDYDRFKYKTTNTTSVLKTLNDGNNNPIYFLRKINIINATKEFYMVYLGKKGLEKNSILKSEQGQKAHLFFSEKGNYFTFITNTSHTSFEIKSLSISK